MPQIVPVSLERHASKSWRPPANLKFASREAIVPVVGMEMARIAATTPMAFIRTPGGYQLVALLSARPQSNLFLSRTGEWIGAHLPLAFRAYPFLLKPTTQGTYALCVDEESGLVLDAADQERFFEETGELSARLQAILRFLEAIQASAKATQDAVDVLAKLELLTAWPAELPIHGQRVILDGLFGVDEEKLRSLPDAEFLTLRQAGALTIAYVQLVSTGQLTVLKYLSELSGKDPAGLGFRGRAPSSLDEVFGIVSSDETLKFNFE